MMRIGQGYDIHPLIEQRPLILGGIHIPYIKGLDGDSDADVLCHSLIDALLGAIGEGDIGRFFGVGTPELMGITSTVLLERTMAKVHDKKFKIVNADTIIIAQLPRLTPHIPAMQKHIAPILGIPEDCLNIKATTPKHLGALGAGKGIACLATVLLESIE